MNVRKIKVKNFKSFKELEVSLGRFNVLIGANASGKSNFVRLFEFLSDIAGHGIDNAISMQGGVEYVTNLNLGRTQELSVEVVASEEREGNDVRIFPLYQSSRGEKVIAVTPLELTYSFSMSFQRGSRKFSVSTERLVHKAEFRVFGKNARRPELKGVGEIQLSSEDGKITLKTEPPRGLALDDYEVFPFFAPRKVSRASLFLNQVSPWFTADFRSIAVYDFDPKLPKKATPITGKADLEGDGSNLAIVLRNIIDSKNDKRKLANLLQDLLPFVADLNVEKFADKSLLFTLREVYARKKYLPASLISDGTVNITALIVALYFETKPIAIIEEPERNVHPYLLSKIVGMMKDASRRKQIIVTSHNPEVVRNADIEDILLVSRDDDGYSRISRPAEKEGVRAFLQSEMGLGELFVQNLLQT